MPEVLEHTRPAPGAAPGQLHAGRAPAGERSRRAARDDLRAQIADLERRLGELFTAAFPRRGIDWRVGAAGGPRVLDTGDLERVRDALAFRLREAELELGHKIEVERANRDLLAEMVAAPSRHRWIRVSNTDIGEPGCRHWHSRPRWGLLGLLLNWWRVKISSGCPLPGRLELAQA